jgi:LCP family protein required for cell wall assembly
VQKRTIGVAVAIAAILILASVGAVFLFGGSHGGVSTSSTEALPTSTATSTTTPTSTTATTPTSTTAAPTGVAIDLSLPGGGDLAVAAQGFYSWLGDPQGQPSPPMADGLAAFLAGVEPPAPYGLEGQFATATLADGSQVAVISAQGDVLLAVDEGTGWRIVGAKLASLGLGPWYGDPVRFVMIIGTDARPGYIEPAFRGDSLHLLSSNIAEQAGAVLGFPRDSYVQAPYGYMDKLSSVNARANSAALVQVVRDLTGLPVEGYLVTGFQSFTNLVDNFGGVVVNVPFSMSNSAGSLAGGQQRLWGANALWFARNRSLNGGDFTRSEDQGRIILGALDGALAKDILGLPDLLALLSQYTWTDLSPEALLTMAAGAYEIDPAAVTNTVLPGRVATINGASVVVLDDSDESIYRDLDDGVLDTTQ